MRLFYPLTLQLTAAYNKTVRMKGGIAMNNPQKYIISLDSMTHAQKAKTLLAVNGYSAEVARAPGSCGFGVSVYGKKGRTECSACRRRAENKGDQGTLRERPVNFDNAATSFPKPPQVIAAATNAMTRYGGNPSRGGHRLAMAASAAVYEVREAAAKMFGGTPENTVFTYNCTHALNYAIKGVMRPGDHIVISSLEHNSVSRPAAALGRRGCEMSVFTVYPDDERTLRSLAAAVTPKTRVVACTAASNVTGQLLPISRIGSFCRENGICLIVDGAQACGIVPLSLSGDNINILCTAGHKALYGLTGTGLLLSDGKYEIAPFIEGGTGSDSGNILQPDYLPDSLEAGTLNTIGILSLGAGMRFIASRSMTKLRAREESLCGSFIDGLERLGAVIYREKGAKYVPVVSFNLKGVSPGALAERLSERGFCLRSGLHCAGLAHKTLNTGDGTVRFAPSVFNNEQEVARLLTEIKNFL